METQQRPAEHWQLDGNSAEAYERYLVPRMLAPWATHLVEDVEVQSGSRVLDVGCGTGIVAREAALRVGEEGTVVGLDVNEGMLAVARSISSDAHPAVMWQQGSVLQMPFPDEVFDVVLAQQMLQFVAGPVAALREMHRVLAPGGRLGLTVWRALEHHAAYRTMAEALEQYVGVEAGTMMRSPFSSWDREALRGMLDRAGFRQPHLRLGIRAMRYPSVAEFLRREAASSPLAGPIGALSKDCRRGLVRHLEHALQSYMDDEGVVFPMETWIIQACP